MQKQKGLTNTQIKRIAIFFMLIDHIGFSVVTEFMNRSASSAEGLIAYYLCRLFGRIAFPLFCFLIAEGVAHTRNLSKYAIRMLLFAVVSEIPFDLMGAGTVFSLQAQNVFWTFTLFLAAVTAARKGRWPVWPFILAAAVVAEVLQTDYGWSGVVLLYLMMSGTRELQQISGSVLIVSASIRLFANPILGIMMAVCPCVCFIAILNGYNGMRGQSVNKYAFYGFYPVHMLILWLCTFWM